MKVTPAPLVMLVSQRHQADCGVASLAMYLGVSYEDALIAFGDHRILAGGVWFTQIQRAAAKFGVTLRKKREWDAERDEGLAQIRYRRGPQHVLVLREGLLFDTDCSVWAPADYLRARRATFGALLTQDE